MSSTVRKVRPHGSSGKVSLVPNLEQSWREALVVKVWAQHKVLQSRGEFWYPQIPHVRQSQQSELARQLLRERVVKSPLKAKKQQLMRELRQGLIEAVSQVKMR